MNIISLQSDKKVNLKVIIVHGSEFKRRSFGFISLSEFMSSTFARILSFWFISTSFVLFIIRRLTTIGRRYFLYDFIVALIDMTIAYVGGGHLRYNHRWEKVFFMLMIFGMFFMQSLGLCGVLFQSFLFVDHNGIDTFEKLSKLNITIYSPHLLEGKSKIIHQMIE